MASAGDAGQVWEREEQGQRARRRRPRNVAKMTEGLAYRRNPRRRDALRKEPTSQGTSPRWG